MRWLLAVTSLLVAAFCPPTWPGSAVESDPPAAPSRAVRVILAGDLMVGRGVAGIFDRDPDAVFSGIRHLLAGADVAAANLESPLTARGPLDPLRNDLRGDPSAASVLAAAGFDVLSLANNHVADAGPAGIADARSAIVSAGMAPVGAGATSEDARRPVILEVAGITVGFLAFDATAVEPSSSVHRWDHGTGTASVQSLAALADVTVVSVHGGSEYLPTTDPFLTGVAEQLVAAGADVVWGHGPHVVQPVTVRTGSAGEAVVATSLGNLLFDQFGEARTTGALLEVLADPDGVIAFRVADVAHPDRRVELVGWKAPLGDAAWLDGSWWTVVRRLPAVPTTAIRLPAFRHGDLVAAARGEITGDQAAETVAAFRRPSAPTPLSTLLPDHPWIDAHGRSAHVGVYRGEGLEEVWVAGAVLQPVGRLEVCDGSLSVLHTSLDDPAPAGVAAWTWNGFGFDASPVLPFHTGIGCADIDGDGRREPLAITP